MGSTCCGGTPRAPDAPLAVDASSGTAENRKGQSGWVLDSSRQRLGVKTHGLDEKIQNYFQVSEKTIGEGAYGKVRKAQSKDEQKALMAIKEVKKRIESGGSREGVSKDTIAKEVEVMDKLDHPNIARLYEVYQDHYNMYLVLEFCSGGDLCDAIQASSNFNERSASYSMQQILTGVNHMHNKGVCHRDLKPDNVLLSSPLTVKPLEKNHLKVIDFGCACSYKEGEAMKLKVGSLFYIAPEVLERNYGHKCDVWSLGITAFILLAGYPPFRNEREIRRKDLPFPQKDFKGVSDDAKQFVKLLVERNAEKRYTCEKALDHVWIAQHAPKSNNTPLSNVQEHLKEFTNNHAFKKAALNIVARSLTDKQIKHLRETFLSLDKDKSGTISKEELEAGLKHTNLGAEVQEVLKGLDTNGDGTIEYNEFIAGSLDKKEYTKEFCVVLVSGTSLCWP